MPRFDEQFKGPLAGKIVLDLSRLVAGNMVSLQLADYGAEVIKIEPAGKGDPLRQWMTDGIPVSWKVYARNKKSVSLNLRDEAAREMLLALVEAADVSVPSVRNILGEVPAAVKAPVRFSLNPPFPVPPMAYVVVAAVAPEASKAVLPPTTIPSVSAAVSTM